MNGIGALIAGPWGPVLAIGAMALATYLCRIAGAVIAETIMTHPDFQQEFAAAKTELRAALGL